MKRFAVYFLIFIFGWLSGLVHFYVANNKAMDDERFVLDKVEEAMNKKIPFRLKG